VDHSEIPGDLNGDVLRDLIRDGDDLSLERDIDFALAFVSKKGALMFVSKARSLGLNAVLDDDNITDEYFYVDVTRKMIPRHADIGQFEDYLENLAAPFGGRNNGWGCFVMRGEH
jgi:hypothetical protein